MASHTASPEAHSRAVTKFTKINLTGLKYGQQKKAVSRKQLQNTQANRAKA